MLRLLVTALLAVLAAPVAAAGPATAEGKAAVAPLMGLVGTWKGEGWILLPGVEGRQQFTSSEVVRSHFDGAGLVIEGRHHAAPGMPNAGALIHDALAIISLDPFRKSMRFRALLASGEFSDAPLEVPAPGRFTWRLRPAEGVLIRYEADVADGRSWVERGFLSTDGGTSWRQTFEMRLRKQD